MTKPSATRPYSLGQRQARADKTRGKLLAAARKLLMTRQGIANFSLDAVARQARVTRLTIYHQFGSKLGLLEALYDDIGQRGGIAARLSSAFRQPDPNDCLDAIADGFVEFWHSQRLVLRRLRGMAALDPAFKRGRERDERRRQAMRAAVERIVAAGKPPPPDPEELVEVLCILTSFETYDALAGATPDLPRIKRLVRRLMRAAIAASHTTGGSDVA